MTKDSQNTNSATTTDASGSPERDFFYELREKKRNAPKTAPVFSHEESSSPKPRKPFSRLFAAALFGVILGFAGTFFLTGAKATLSENRDSHKQVQRKLLQPQSQEAVAKIEMLQSKHNAVDWVESIDSSRRDNPFSIELEDALIRSDARPVLVRSTLLDISYGNLGVVAKFGIPGSSEDFRNILLLETRKEQLRIFASALRGISQYAVVAKCTSAQSNESGGRVILGRLIDVVEIDRK